MGEILSLLNVDTVLYSKPYRLGNAQSDCRDISESLSSCSSSL